MGFAVTLLHTVLFGCPIERAALRDRSRSIHISPCWCRRSAVWRSGLHCMLLARWRPAREVDPIEANALHGGRMSLRGSLIVAAADDLVERRRRLGRAGGRLHAACERHRLLDRAGVPAAPARPARAGRLRRGRRDRRRVRRAACRRVLRVRTGDRRAIRSPASRRSASRRWSAIWWPTCSSRPARHRDALRHACRAGTTSFPPALVGLAAAGLGITADARRRRCARRCSAGCAYPARSCGRRSAALIVGAARAGHAAGARRRATARSTSPAMLEKPAAGRSRCCSC